MIEWVAEGSAANSPNRNETKEMQQTNEKESQKENRAET
jgi:hypothetical protein